MFSTQQLLWSYTCIPRDLATANLCAKIFIFDSTGIATEEPHYQKNSQKKIYNSLVGDFENL